MQQMWAPSQSTSRQSSSLLVFGFGNEKYCIWVDNSLIYQLMDDLFSILLRSVCNILKTFILICLD